MYQIYRVPVDAYDDPPVCGTPLPQRFNNLPAAIREADRTMEQEHDPKVAYFVVPGGYSVGLVE
jgi:hypothetical protein